MPQPEILRLGRRLAREIGDDDGQDSIRRWLAHHLAELIEAAAHDSAAADQAVDTILRIWAKRESLPGHAWPLGRYREAVMVLERLSPAAEPWHRLRSNEDAVAMGDLFSGLNRLLLLALLLQIPPAHRLADGEVPDGAMDEDEATLLTALNGLMAFLNQPKRAPEVPRVVVKVVDPTTDPDPGRGPTGPDIESNAAEEEEVEDGLTDRRLVELMREMVGDLHGALDDVLTSTERLVVARAEAAHREKSVES